MTRGIRGLNRIERFLDKIEIGAGECWLWSARVGNSGYGKFWDGERHIGAHRYSFLFFHGPIDEGNAVCHSCDVKVCVNPDHLWQGTAKENVADMVAKGRANFVAGNVASLAVIHATRRSLTQCKHGHEFTPENTITKRDGTRACRECVRRWGREYARRKRAAA